MINVVLLGTGNVATHLFEAFSASEKIAVRQVYNHAEGSLSQFKSKTKTTTNLKELFDADVFVLALKDDVIPEIAAQLQHKKELVVHTSGTVSLDALGKCRRSGVFYPLQTFSKNQPVKSKIPFCLEAKHRKDLELLKELAGGISGKAYEISSEQRRKLHLAAVFVCNFVNHMYALGEELCTKNNVPFEILQPLIRETAKKVESSSPFEVQTGPAIRTDESTINAHLELLPTQQQKEIYQLLTNAIQSSHGKKL